MDQMIIPNWVSAFSRDDDYCFWYMIGEFHDLKPVPVVRRGVATTKGVPDFTNWIFPIKVYDLAVRCREYAYSKEFPPTAQEMFQVYLNAKNDPDFEAFLEMWSEFKIEE